MNDLEQRLRDEASDDVTFSIDRHRRVMANLHDNSDRRDAFLDRPQTLRRPAALLIAAAAAIACAIVVWNLGTRDSVPTRPAIAERNPVRWPAMPALATLDHDVLAQGGALIEWSPLADGLGDVAQFLAEQIDRPRSIVPSPTKLERGAA